MHGPVDQLPLVCVSSVDENDEKRRAWVRRVEPIQNARHEHVSPTSVHQHQRVWDYQKEWTDVTENSQCSAEKNCLPRIIRAICNVSSSHGKVTRFVISSCHREDATWRHLSWITKKRTEPPGNPHEAHQTCLGDEWWSSLTVAVNLVMHIGPIPESWTEIRTALVAKEDGGQRPISVTSVHDSVGETPCPTSRQLVFHA